MSRVLALLVLAAVLCGAAAAAPPGRWVPVVVHKESGRVDAVLTVERQRSSFGVFDYRDLHLRVALDGKTVFDQGLCNENDCGIATQHTLTLGNVWGDAVPEVLLDTYSGGAHCCFGTYVVFLDGSRAGHALFHLWGDPGYRLERRGGTVEFVSADDRFAYEFTSFAGSGLPLEVLTLDANGAFENVTKSQPALLRADAKQWWQAYVSQRGKADADVRGVVGAWCADEYQLGQGKACESELRRALSKGYLSGPTIWPQNANFVALLHKQLAKWGYSATWSPARSSLRTSGAHSRPRSNSDSVRVPFGSRWVIRLTPRYQTTVPKAMSAIGSPAGSTRSKVVSASVTHGSISSTTAAASSGRFAEPAISCATTCTWPAALSSSHRSTIAGTSASRVAAAETTSL